MLAGPCGASPLPSKRNRDLSRTPLGPCEIIAIGIWMPCARGRRVMRSTENFHDTARASLAHRFDDLSAGPSPGTAHPPARRPRARRHVRQRPRPDGPRAAHARSRQGSTEAWRKSATSSAIPTSNVWALFTEFDLSFSDGDRQHGQRQDRRRHELPARTSHPHLRGRQGSVEDHCPPVDSGHLQRIPFPGR